MIYALIPYYHEDSPEFKKSLSKQPYHIAYRYDRKLAGTYWTEAMNDLRERIIDDGRIRDTDVVCILNNDIELAPDLFAIGSKVKPGEVYIPRTIENGETTQWGLRIDWRVKRFFYFLGIIDCFAPRGVFLTVGDLKKAKFRLKHYLSDIDWSIRLIELGIRPIQIDTWVKHTPHTVTASIFSPLNPRNPFAWTQFLIYNCPRKYLIQNLFKAWSEVLR